MSTARTTRSSTASQRQPLTSIPATRTTKPTKRSKPPRQEGEAERLLHGPYNGPSTPPSKKPRLSAPALPPATPTPALVGLMAGLHSTGDIDDPLPTTTHALASRPAEPRLTNAPLQTPGGSRLTAYPAEGATASPSKTGKPPPSTTTGQLLDEACAHLVAAEPRLEPVIAQHRCQIFAPEGLAEEVDPFRSLASGIMAQQVSGAAASSIKKKFIGLFNAAPAEGEEPTEWRFPTPAQVAACEVAFLRTAGLSGRKAEYIKGLAEKFVSGELSARMLVDASYEEVLAKLTAVRGLGKWSVEMFACFALKRMDVFSTGDLGVQRGMAALMGRDVKKLKAKGGGKWKYMSEAEMLACSEKFAPYRYGCNVLPGFELVLIYGRSLFMWYMWRIEDVNVEAIQNS
ncbi:3-methyladenine DNA glycosylase [Xylographa vitiligo]|nr:3-methyladenine DNA glycosylase [Xylographa vitiligo]